MKDIELLAPAGSFETALTAFQAGADAVYLGLDAFSARAEAVNFTTSQLRDLLGVAAGRKKVYVTFNTLLDDAQLPQAAEKLAILEELRPDGVIVQDLGVARMVRRNFPGLELHASTQLVAHNLEDVLALKELGFVRVVLAREMSLEDIRSITRRCGCEIEVFVHGALCYSLSGLCLFSAMEKQRSGNRGKCAYCCRLAYTDAAGHRSLPFSMRDLRLDDRLEALRDAGVASLKIEGRMKSSLYVATVTRHYRELLDGLPPATTRADLETVFSRRTTRLYADGYQTPDPVIDPDSLGHLGTPVGTVKRLTKDREGRTWLRFHTTRALERHDGLQFAADAGKPYGFGISDLRVALSRSTVFSVKAGSDVEVLVPDLPEAREAIRPGATVFCSASNEVKRRFPVPAFRPSDVNAGTPIDIELTLSADGLAASASPSATVPGDGKAVPFRATASIAQPLSQSRNPDGTENAARKAFARLGETDWVLNRLTLVDPDHRFAPASAMNELRRQLVAQLDSARLTARAAKLEAVMADVVPLDNLNDAASVPERTLKLRLNQSLPEDVCDFDELVVDIGHRSGREIETRLAALAAELRTLAETIGESAPTLRLALPVFTLEGEYNALRAAVKHMVKAGMSAWEAADLAGLRTLRELGLTDITADWSLYAFNRQALAQLAELGVIRCVTSPENTEENLRWLADTQSAAGLPSVQFLQSQNTPLFISLTRPVAEDPSLLTGVRGDQFTSFRLERLWVTSATEKRRFRLPGNAASLRIDRAWDA